MKLIISVVNQENLKNSNVPPDSPEHPEEAQEGLQGRLSFSL